MPNQNPKCIKCGLLLSAIIPSGIKCIKRSDHEFPSQVVNPESSYSEKLNSSNPESWEEKLLNIEGFRKKLNGEEVSTVILLIRSLLLQAKQEERADVIQIVEVWMWNNGITDKKSFIALKDFLLSLKEQGNPQKS